MSADGTSRSYVHCGPPLTANRCWLQLSVLSGLQLSVLCCSSRSALDFSSGPLLAGALVPLSVVALGPLLVGGNLGHLLTGHLCSLSVVIY